MKNSVFEDIFRGPSTLEGLSMCRFVEKSWFLMWYTPERILAVTLYQILKVILGNSQWDVWDPELQSLGVLGVFIILLPPQDCPRAKTQGNGKDISRPDGILNFTSVRRCMFSVSFHVTMFQCWDNFTSFIVDMNRDSVISITLGATHHRAITDHWQLCDNLTLTTYYCLLFRIEQQITFTGWMNRQFSSKGPFCL